MSSFLDLPHHQVLARLGEKMEVVEVDFSRMMHLVEECGKEGAREGEEEPQDVDQGLFGLGLLTVKRGIMPGGKMINFRWKILYFVFVQELFGAESTTLRRTTKVSELTGR